jgi:hypothetical protein
MVPRTVPSGDIERGDQRFGAMPDILELAPFDVPRLHGKTPGGALQGLDPGHLVDRNGLTTLFSDGRSPPRYTEQMSAHFSSKPGSGFGVSQ